MRRAAYVSSADEEGHGIFCFGALVGEGSLTVALSVPVVLSPGPDVWDGVRVLVGARDRAADAGLAHVTTMTGGVDDRWRVSSEFRIDPGALPEEIEVLVEHGPVTHQVRLRRVWTNDAI